MDVFLPSLCVVFAAALGGRDTMVLAALAQTLKRTPSILAVGVLCAGLSASVAAWLGSLVGQGLAPDGAQIAVALGLAVAALDLARPVRIKPPAEPTRSLGAIALVLLARQFADAPRLAVLALAALAPGSAAIGLAGWLGGAGALLLAWLLGMDARVRYRLDQWRRAMVPCVIVAAVMIGLNTRYNFM
ncbi:MAG: hypothetical protein ACK4IB_09570 [Erythrobacter sp.]